jgi:hypothetical protein
MSYLTRMAEASWSGIDMEVDRKVGGSIDRIDVDGQLYQKEEAQLRVLRSRSRHCYHLSLKKLFLGRNPCINIGINVR